MITAAEVEKLGRVHAVEPVVLSVYLNVPRSAAELPLPVPDLTEEMVSRTLEDGGQVVVVHDALEGFAARMPSSPRACRARM